jgi:hypothetical protein
MQEASPLQQEAAVSDLVRQGMLKGIDPLGDAGRLVEELGRFQVGEAAMQSLLRQLGNGFQQRHGHLRAKHRCRVQQVFGLRREAVDTCSQHCLDGLGHRDVGAEVTLLPHSMH